MQFAKIQKNVVFYPYEGKVLMMCHFDLLLCILLREWGGVPRPRWGICHHRFLSQNIGEEFFVAHWFHPRKGMHVNSSMNVIFPQNIPARGCLSIGCDFPQKHPRKGMPINSSMNVISPKTTPKGVAHYSSNTDLKMYFSSYSILNDFKNFRYSSLNPRFL